MPALAGVGRAAGDTDPRNVAHGFVIPDENYSDQPYIVITNDGNWLCVMTTGEGVEGRPGQHIVSNTSTDQGETWRAMVDIEPAGGPEASWVMPLKVPSGRVYVFYTYNRDNLRRVNSNQESIGARVDTMGAYMFKYSDDNGRTWSRERYEIPMRKMNIDRENTHGGDVMFFWGVGKPIIVPKPPRRRMPDSPKGPYAIFGFAKVGKWGSPGAMVESQGCFMRSDNVLTEKDPSKVRWVLLPDGDEGLRAPKGPVSDEANLVALSDGSLYATYRTIDGYNCHAYSRDGGHSWTPPEYATYTPGGRRIKHPRAANFVRKFSNGKYLLWFHNHGGEAVHGAEWTQGGSGYYRNRNPGWIAGGIEHNGMMHWSQPEVLLYDDDPDTRISYPDFVEENGRYWVTETQKTVARVHQIDPSLLEGVWSQETNRTVARLGLAAELASIPTGASLRMPNLGSSFSLDFWIRLRELTPGQVLFDATSSGGRGVRLTTSDNFSLRLTMADGERETVWESDAGTHPGTMKTGVWQHIAVIVDGGPRIISYVIDGQFNDGGATRQFGWGRFPKELGDVNGAAEARVAPRIFGEMRGLRIYDRYLRTSEAVGNYRAGNS